MHRQKPLLREVGAPAARKIGQRALRRFRIGKDVRLVRPLVGRGAADLGEEERLALRHPRRRLLDLLAVDAVVVRLRPPAPQILVAKDPRLAESAVGDRRALAQAPRLEGRIIPVETLAAGDRCAQSGRIIRPGKPIGIAGRIVRVAPVRQRHVIVDADRVDIRMRPQRIEVEIDVADAVERMVAEIFAPVGAVGDLRRRPEHRAHLAGQRAERLDEGEIVVLVAQRGQPAQLASRSGRRRRRPPPAPAAHGAARSGESPSRSPSPRN